MYHRGPMVDESEQRKAGLSTTNEPGSLYSLNKPALKKSEFLINFIIEKFANIIQPVICMTLALFFTYFFLEWGQHV